MSAINGFFAIVGCIMLAAVLAFERAPVRGILLAIVATVTVATPIVASLAVHYSQQCRATGAETLLCRILL